METVRFQEHFMGPIVEFNAEIICFEGEFKTRIKKDDGLEIWVYTKLKNGSLCYTPAPSPESDKEAIMADKPMDESTDRKKYFCEKIKKHVWVLGYFGGGGINVGDLFKVVGQLSYEAGIKIETVNVIEIISSRRFKFFKFITSDEPNQEPLEDSIVVDDVYSWLYD